MLIDRPRRWHLTNTVSPQPITQKTNFLVEELHLFPVDVGSKTKSIDIALKSQSSVTKQVDTAFQSVSGVNMDEELVSLLRFNQLYQASAKVIDTATQTFDTLLALG